jgi:hypothetical protein
MLPTTGPDFSGGSRLTAQSTADMCFIFVIRVTPTKGQRPVNPDAFFGTHRVYFQLSSLKKA